MTTDPALYPPEHETNSKRSKDSRDPSCSPHPEADEAIRESDGQWSYELAECARKLEVQRNQAREIAEGAAQSLTDLARKNHPDFEAISIPWENEFLSF